jgi:hypothetical protein
LNHFDKDYEKEVVIINREVNNFGTYLAGLFEREGHIRIPKENMKKKYNPRFCISFHKNDLPLAKIIKKNKVWIY